MPLISLQAGLADIDFNYSGGTVVTPPVQTGTTENLSDLAGPGGGSVGTVGMLLQGQSNSIFWYDDDGTFNVPNIYNNILQNLTNLSGSQISVDATRSEFSSTSSSLWSGTYTYSFNSNNPNWMEPSGHDLTNPSTWGNTSIMNAFLNWTTAQAGSFASNRPLILLRMHTEYDSTMTSSGEIAVYEKANREFIARYRAAAGRTPALSPVFMVPVPYGYAQGAMSAAMRRAWHNQAQDPTHHFYHAVGSTLDAEDRGDISHWSHNAAARVARRMAVRMSKWLHVNGYANRDLSSLPGLGPRYVSFARVSGQSNQLDLTVAHDKGTDLIVPLGPELGDFSVTDGGISIGVIGAVRQSANVVRLSLDSNLSASGAITFDYGGALNPYRGPAGQITDNWHTLTKPVSGNTELDATRMIMQRNRVPITSASTSNGADTGDGGTTPTPTSVVRGRPSIVNNTVKTDQGTRMRGATMALDGPGTDSTNFAIDKAKWIELRDMKLNCVRVDIPLSIGEYPDGSTHVLTLAQQLPDIDKVVQNAADTGMYVILMNSVNSLSYDKTELTTFWGTVAARFKDSTHVFYEMTNEPAWNFNSTILNDLVDIYNIMHAAAPNTLIGVLDTGYANSDPDSLMTDFLSRGPTAPPAFLCIHPYWTASQAQFQASINSHPCIISEHIYQGVTENDSERFSWAEAVGMSWISLCGRWGQETGSDDPYGASIASLRRILNEMAANGYTWTADVLGGTGGTTTPPAETYLSLREDGGWILREGGGYIQRENYVAPTTGGGTGGTGGGTTTPPTSTDHRAKLFQSPNPNKWIFNNQFMNLVQPSQDWAATIASTTQGAVGWRNQFTWLRADGFEGYWQPASSPMYRVYRDPSNTNRLWFRGKNQGYAPQAGDDVVFYSQDQDGGSHGPDVGVSGHLTGVNLGGFNLLYGTKYRIAAGRQDAATSATEYAVDFAGGAPNIDITPRNTMGSAGWIWLRHWNFYIDNAKTIPRFPLDWLASTAINDIIGNGGCFILGGEQGQPTYRDRTSEFGCFGSMMSELQIQEAQWLANKFAGVDPRRLLIELENEPVCNWIYTDGTLGYKDALINYHYPQYRAAFPDGTLGVKPSKFGSIEDIQSRVFDWVVPDGKNTFILTHNYDGQFRIPYNGNQKEFTDPTAIQAYVAELKAAQARAGAHGFGMTEFGIGTTRFWDFSQPMPDVDKSKGYGYMLTEMANQGGIVAGWFRVGDMYNSTDFYTDIVPGKTIQALYPEFRPYGAVAGLVTFDTPTPVDPPAGGGSGGTLPPLTQAIQIDPSSPGTIALSGGVANWPVTIRTQSLTSVEWRVYDLSSVPRSGWNNITNSSLTDATKGVSIVVPFVATGDFLDVRKVNDWNVYAETSMVTVTAEVVAPPVTKSMSLSPANPGTLNQASAGANVAWSTTLTTTGITSVTWQIRTSAGGTRGTTTQVATTGSVVVNVQFIATGEYIRVWETSTPTQFVDSGSVTLVLPAATGRSIALSPQNPGTRAAGTLATTVTTTGIASITWVVVNPDFTWPNTGTVVQTNGTVVINPNYTVTGQFLKVLDTSDFAFAIDGGQVTIQGSTTPAPTSGATIDSSVIKVDSGTVFLSAGAVTASLPSVGVVTFDSDTAAVSFDDDSTSFFDKQ